MQRELVEVLLWGMTPGKLVHEEVTRSIIGCFYEVYSTLGYGFLEHVYVMALERELRDAGHRVAREVCVPVMYKGHELAIQRIDMIVDAKVVVEAKASRELHDAAQRQLLNYLRATSLEVGLLLHFGPDAKFYRAVSTRKDSANTAKSADSAFPLRRWGRPEVVKALELDQSPPPTPSTPDSMERPEREA